MTAYLNGGGVGGFSADEVAGILARQAEGLPEGFKRAWCRSARKPAAARQTPGQQYRRRAAGEVPAVRSASSRSRPP